MDLDTLKPAERIVEILHPGTGEKIGVKVTVISISDDKMTAIRRKIQNKRIELDRRGKAFKADDLEENELELLLAGVIGWCWEGETTFKGEKPEFNERNLKLVLKELPWFKQQLQEAIGDEKAFFQS